MLKKLLAGAALSFCAVSASAGVITQTFWFGDDTSTAAQELVITSGAGGGTNISELELDWGPASFTFDLFDTLGGTRQLDSVELILDGTSTGNISGTNGGTNSADLTLELGALLSVTTSFAPFGVIDLVTVFPQYAETFDDVASGATVGSGAVSTSASNTETYLSSDSSVALIFALFIGTGTSSFDIDAESEFNASGGGSGSVSRTNTADGSLQIVYNFTDLPLTTVSEPGYLALFGVMLLLASRMRRSY